MKAAQERSTAIALELLRHGPQSRSELARRLDLSPGSVTRLTKPMTDSGLLVELDATTGQRAGRPSQPLDIAARRHRFIGAKVSGTVVHAVATDLRAEILDSGRADLPGSRPDDVVATVAGLVAGLTGPEPAAIGVSLGGKVTDRAKVVGAPFLGWTEEVPLRALLTEATGQPVVIDNDLSALTTAEQWFGAGRESDRLAIITTGAGVGYGLIIHDTVVDGPDSGIGLLGHYPLDPAGPRCPEGHRGCASAMLGAESISAAVSIGLRRPVDYPQVLELAAGGDPVATSVLTDSARALGKLVANVATLTMTSDIVLTGEGIGLAEIADEALREAVLENRHPQAETVSITVRPDDPTHWARGAATTAIQHHMLNSVP
jgi:predicted NBD/HSP70 family sugar kinase